MDKMFFVLPTSDYGTPEDVDQFLEEYELSGSSFVTIADAENFLLEMKEKYSSEEDAYKNFAIFVNEFHAVKTPAGFKVIQTVENN